MLLSPNNLLKPSDGGPVAVPSQDMVLGVYYLTMHKLADRKDHFAFGPFLCTGIVLALLVGEPILQWYFRFF